MAIKAVLSADDYNEIEEEARDLYKEVDGRYVLELDGLDEHPNVTALRNGHKRSKQERDEAKRAAADLKRKFGALADVDDLDFSDIMDVDPDRLSEIGKYLRGEGELPKQDAKGNAVDIDKIKDTARKPLLRDLEQAQTRASELQSRLERTVAINELSSAMAGVKVLPQYQKAVMAMLLGRVKVQQDDAGNDVGIIDGEYGEQPVEKFMREWAQTDEGKAFIEAAGNSGGGAHGGGSGSGKVNNPWSREHWNMTEQARIFREDPERARKMAAAHGKKVGA
jgi:hypothetical protein